MSITGPYVLFETTKTAVLALNSRFWPQSQALITRSEVAELLSTEGTRYAPRIEYQFTVNEKEYHGSRLAFGHKASKSKSTVEALLQHYAIGTQHSVWYDRANPAVSVLERGIHIDNILVPILAAIVTLIGPWIARENLLELRRLRREAQTRQAILNQLLWKLISPVRC